MFEVRTEPDVIQILSAGGGVEMDAALKPTDVLVRMASAARGSGASLVLKGLGMRPTADLVRIASAGGGAVIFGD